MGILWDPWGFNYQILSIQWNLMEFYGFHEILRLKSYQILPNPMESYGIHEVFNYQILSNLIISKMLWLIGSEGAYY